jgi:hypothetical protein
MRVRDQPDNLHITHCSILPDRQQRGMIAICFDAHAALGRKGDKLAESPLE